jgi:hypothetical protein
MEYLMARGIPRCVAETLRGTRCSYRAMTDKGMCNRHTALLTPKKKEQLELPLKTERVHSALQYLLFEAPQSQINAILEVRKGLKR